ncbi:GTP 3',8-cyclase MoaA [Thermincola ferriacetica]
MLDNFAREINYLRVSVTDRCNYRCVYCMPAEGVPMHCRDEILSLEEILKVIKSSTKLGIRKIRLTGGEPLVRKGIINLVQGIARIPQIDDIALTTNGALLPAYATALKEAGLKRVNISLDTLKPDRFRQITRVGRLRDVWAGIEAAWEEGFEPVKINTVVIRGFNDDELLDFVNLTKKLPLHIRFIELMPIGVSDKFPADKFISVRQIKAKISQYENLEVAKKLAGNGPARYYKIPGAAGSIGFISALSDHFCGQCNRLRLTSEGKLRPCLHSPQEVDLKASLRLGLSEEELAEIMRQAVLSKPEGHTMNARGWGDNNRTMSQIGG